MQIKRFRGETTREALSLVKKEFGPEALIVETRTLGPGLCEVVAAMDRDEPEARGGINLGALQGTGDRGGVSADFLLNEMQEIKELLVSMAGGGEDEGEALRAFRKELRANGLDGSLVMRLLARARATSTRSGDGSGSDTDMARLRRAVRRELSRIIKVRDPVKEARVISFIGPTGAGKTTTLAKLAAMTSLARKKRVVMITLDTLRIGAPDQILKYGQMMGVEVGIAASSGDVPAFVRKHADADLVLIDTPGASPGDSARMEEIRGLATRVPGIKFNLVLSVRERDDCLYETLRRSASLPIEWLTFTKLDESRSFGQMLGLSVRSKRPISYLGTGQKVPGDLVEATVEGVLDYLVPA